METKTQHPYVPTPVKFFCLVYKTIKNDISLNVTKAHSLFKSLSQILYYNQPVPSCMDKVSCTRNQQVLQVGFEHMPEEPDLPTTTLLSPCSFKP